MAAVTDAVIVLDTNCLIYYLDDSTSDRGRWLGEQVFMPAVRGELQIVLPTVCLAELLVRPYALGQDARAVALRRALVQVPGLSVVPLSEDLAVAASRLRGRRSLSLPDAIVLATATAVGGSVLTNDRRLAVDVGAAVRVLDDVMAERH